MSHRMREKDRGDGRGGHHSGGPDRCHQGAASLPEKKYYIGGEKGGANLIKVQVVNPP